MHTQPVANLKAMYPTMAEQTTWELLVQHMVQHVKGLWRAQSLHQTILWFANTSCYIKTVAQLHQGIPGHQKNVFHTGTCKILHFTNIRKLLPYPTDIATPNASHTINRNCASHYAAHQNKSNTDQGFPLTKTTWPHQSTYIYILGYIFDLQIIRITNVTR